MSINIKVLLLAALGVIGIYVIPTAVAKYAGSHTWEINATTGEVSLNCIRCHDYIFSELNATSRTEEVLNAHSAAAGNQSYTQGWLNLSIDNSTSYGVCQVCHLNQLSATTSHTKVTVRACTDLDCHGNNATSNNTAYFEGLMGPFLGGTNDSEPTNVHMRVFNQVSGFSSAHFNETGSDYTRGFYFCIGCHTQTEFEITKTGVEEWNHSEFGFAKRRYL